MLVVPTVFLPLFLFKNYHWVPLTPELSHQLPTWQSRPFQRGLRAPSPASRPPQVAAERHHHISQHKQHFPVSPPCFRLCHHPPLLLPPFQHPADPDLNSVPGAMRCIGTPKPGNGRQVTGSDSAVHAKHTKPS